MTYKWKLISFLCLCSDAVSLHHYYLQLRENIRLYWDSPCVPEEKVFEVCAYALQADFGDYEKHKHQIGYFRSENYFPLWVCCSTVLSKLAR